MWEADSRHVELVIAELGLQTAKPVFTPGTKISADEFENSPYLGPSAITPYRTTCARIGYLAEERWDIKHAAKECLKGMSKPKVVHVRMLKGIGRYLLYRPRFALLLRWQTKPASLTVFSDSDHAGNPTTRKSTNGGVVMIGSNAIMAWSTTQAVPSLSSGESEWHGVTKAAAEGLGVQAGIHDLGDELDLEVCTDSSAALGIGLRRGLGKLKHVESRYFWLQHAVHNKRLSLRKEGTKTNRADPFTKYLDRETLERHLTAIGFVVLTGRHSLVPKLTVDTEQLSRQSQLKLLALIREA